MDNDLYISDIPSAYWYVREHEFATCSNCGFDVFTDWDTTKIAEEEVKTFHKDWKYCPGCGRKMGQPPTKEGSN